MTARLRLLLFALPLLAGLAGCGHYRLGTDAELPFNSIFIEPVVVKALIPQSRALFTTQLRDTFIQDGRVALANTSETADTILQVVVRTYQREVATARPDDTGLARKFTVTLTADATLRDRRNGKALFEQRPLVVKRELFTDSGQLQAEYQLLPLLAADLAAKASHAVLDVW
jgi:hypothetical protein